MCFHCHCFQVAYGCLSVITCVSMYCVKLILCEIVMLSQKHVLDSMAIYILQMSRRHTWNVRCWSVRDWTKIIQRVRAEKCCSVRLFRLTWKLYKCAILSLSFCGRAYPSTCAIFTCKPRVLHRSSFATHPSEYTSFLVKHNQQSKYKSIENKLFKALCCWSLIIL